MDDWQIPSQPTLPPTPSQQQQQRMSMNTIGPMHSYHSMRTRPSPYPMNEVKQPYSYQQTSMPMKTNTNSNVYTPLSYPPNHMEQIPHQQRLITAKSTSGPIATYNAGQQQMHAARARSMPYPSPMMYTHSPASVYQCNNTPHMNYPNQPSFPPPPPPPVQQQQQQQQMYYQNYYPQAHPISHQANSNSNKHEPMKNKIKPNADDFFSSPSTSYHPSVCSNSYVSPQQLPPQPSSLSSSISQEYQTFPNQFQIFPSPPSNPSTPYQGEFNANADFGVPYHQGQPSSVNSLTDALCPSGDTADRQLTPGPPSVGTPRVAHPQYSFPQTPSTPTMSRLPNEQNIDELTAFLQDPANLYLTDDITSTLFDDIEVLADTYLGGRGNNDHQSNNDSSLDYDIILNYLCSDDLISTVCQK
ncbi:unnamed protein product [Adineta ricciae]|uniref:Uncharacterized protein n=1 Tax=Adineta ricciae TaxID=249248 RepID=A0A813YXI9_ADIRI|nr:unnamed protein product [Adineta ricciae]CAF1098507.1 unnamed protein product [Adineta ricciae]